MDISEQRTFDSSSCVTATKTSQSSIPSDDKNSLSAASAFNTNTPSNSSEACSHCSIFFSINLVLNSLLIFLARDFPIFPAPAMYTFLYWLSSFCNSFVTSSICFSSAIKKTSSPSFIIVSPVGIKSSSFLYNAGILVSYSGRSSLSSFTCLPTKTPEDFAYTLTNLILPSAKSRISSAPG